MQSTEGLTGTGVHKKAEVEERGSVSGGDVGPLGDAQTPTALREEVRPFECLYLVLERCRPTSAELNTF